MWYTATVEERHASGAPKRLKIVEECASRDEAIAAIGEIDSPDVTWIETNVRLQPGDSFTVAEVH